MKHFLPGFIERKGFANMKPKEVYQLSMKNIASEMRSSPCWQQYYAAVKQARIFLSIPSELQVQ